MNRHIPTTETRREFLKTTAPAAAGGTFGLAGALSGAIHAQSPTVHARGSEEPIKLALIGCGNRGTGAVAQALSTEGPVQLYAVADAFEDRMQSSLKSLQRGMEKKYDRESTQPLADRINVPPERQFVGLDAYRKAIDSGVDVAIIAAPPGFRPQHFQYAVDSGKHVFMEKPVATDPHGVLQVIEVAAKAKQKNLKVGVGLQRHHQASYLEALRRVREGQIGEIVTMRCFWNTGRPAKTPVAREQSVSELQHQVRNWYFFDWLSGDHICEQHIHNLDVCNWFKGDYPIEAEGMGGRQVRTGKEYGNIFDHHAVIFTYPDGTKLQSYCRQIPGCKNRVSETIESTKGRAELGSVRCEILVGEDSKWESSRGEKSPYQVEQDDLFQAIRHDLPYNEAEAAARSTMTAILGRFATYSGKIIRLDDALASAVRLTTDAENWNGDAPLQPEPDGGYPIPVPGVTKVL
ncbi:Gfo/Idh/MocA family oxidoreductase [Roseiconus nitratireducens]|uniref:Gfo/Idh/MocA family oxidoreductase n=1 Tax=Roseiconus nitratireducens TaxID=2605748 RepID=A0A5M6DB94_9BACT|nr:Gfo/Idh/MocA family oxidoreductase [Roseiconus nitratireducens]KAA5544643.1 Gfo/Idh/MocA family oxidoreductase [Roseiconus nitratireducens]